MSPKNHKYSESEEDYLEAIYMLGGKNVRSVDIANMLQLSRASVNKAINALMEKGLVQKELYGEVTLTDLGKKNSKRVLKKHLLIKNFLIEILGVSPEVADTEACGIEHNISEDTASRIENLMNELQKKES